MTSPLTSSLPGQSPPPQPRAKSASDNPAVSALVSTYGPIPAGPNGQVLQADSSNALGFSFVPASGLNILDAKGDLVGATANDTPARVPVGTDGQVLAASAAAANGVTYDTHLIPLIDWHNAKIIDSAGSSGVYKTDGSNIATGLGAGSTFDGTGAPLFEIDPARLPSTYKNLYAETLMFINGVAPTVSYGLRLYAVTASAGAGNTTTLTMNNPASGAAFPGTAFNYQAVAAGAMIRNLSAAFPLPTTGMYVIAPYKGGGSGAGEALVMVSRILAGP